MYQFDAFKVLGVEITDAKEVIETKYRNKLSERNFDKHFLNEQYENLINPNKRLQCEIVYLKKDIFEEFDNYIDKKDVKGIVSKKIAKPIVGIGKFFDNYNKDLLDLINKYRKINNFHIVSEQEYKEARSDLKDYYFVYIEDFFESISNSKRLIKDVFNSMFLIKDYQSSLIDELTAYYEAAMNEIISTKIDSTNKLLYLVEIDIQKINDKFCIPRSFEKHIEKYICEFEKMKEYMLPIINHHQIKKLENESITILGKDLFFRFSKMFNSTYENAKLFYDRCSGISIFEESSDEEIFEIIERIVGFEFALSKLTIIFEHYIDIFNCVPLMGHYYEKIANDINASIELTNKIDEEFSDRIDSFLSEQKRLIAEEKKDKKKFRKILKILICILCIVLMTISIVFFLLMLKL